MKRKGAASRASARNAPPPTALPRKSDARAPQPSALTEALLPYRALVEQVDLLCGRIVGDYAEALRCQAGCAGCCRLSGVLPVEAASLYLAWRSLPEAPRRALRSRLEHPGATDCCPLLFDRRCPLYAARPIICRTHGLPLLIEEDGAQRIDRCPLNFTGYDALPGAAIIHLERLNTALVTVNRQFVTRLFPAGDLPERIPLTALLAVLWPGHRPSAL
jgi:Fe-S-cluster containining protein